jgi:uncharacterized protein YbjT (DUF2867 family)
MLLLTGASGTVGRALVAELAGRQDVRALARSDESAQALLDAELPDVVRGDLGDRDTLPAALEGVRTLFLLTPPGPSQPKLELNALEAARVAGVRRVVYLSLYDAGPPVITLRAWHEPAERWLRESSLSWAVLQPPVFSQNLLGQVDAIRQGQLVWPGGQGDLSHIDVGTSQRSPVPPCWTRRSRATSA